MTVGFSGGRSCICTTLGAFNSVRLVERDDTSDLSRLSYSHFMHKSFLFSKTQNASEGFPHLEQTSSSCIFDVISSVPVLVQLKTTGILRVRDDVEHHADNI